MKGYEEKHKKRHSTQQKKKKKKVGGYWEGELPVAIATAGTLVQSPRQCLVARERFGQRGKGAQQAAAPPPHPPFPPPPSPTLQDPGWMTGIIPTLVSLKRHHLDGFFTHFF